MLYMLYILTSISLSYLRCYLRLPTPEELQQRLGADLRCHVLLLHLTALLIMARVRIQSIFQAFHSKKLNFSSI